MFSKIWGVLLHVDHCAGVHKGVVGEGLAVAKGDALICVERAGKFISINNSEDAAIELNISTDLEVAPCV